MENLLTCEYEYDDRVSFAMQQNHVPLIKYLSIENISADKQENLEVEITSNPSFFEPKVIHMEELTPEEVIELHPDIQLSANFLSTLEESMTGHIKIKVKSGEDELYHRNLPVDVLSFDSWPGSSVLPEIISSFITPNRPFIMEIIKQASKIMEKNTDSNAMDGYQSGDPNRVIAQLSAIFSAIQAHDITYANPPASFEAEGQKIRFPDLLKEHKLGTCLDLSLLYAACAEAIGIHPIIVFFQDHAFPAFWLKDFAASESFQDDKSMLTKSMAGGIHDITVVESTLLTNTKAHFDGAIRSAEQTLNKPDYFRFFIDVHRSRIGQVKPLSLKTSTGAKIQAAVQAEEPVRINNNFAFEQVEVIEESDQPTDNQQSKITYWQNKLIDMSLRNNLLNYRIHTQGIPVVTSNIDQIEDILSMGKKVFIQPLPNEWRNKVRDFRDQKELLTSKILTEDMQNNRLRSILSEAKLEKELVKLYRKAKNTLEETGANSLFIALGFLKWYDPKSYDKERFAPILLLPVDLVRLSAKKGYYIRARDEEIQINISLIEYLKQTFGIDASRLYNIPKDEYGADVRKVLTTIRRIIMQMKNWDVYENASIGVFSFSKFVMWNDLVNHSEELKENKAVKSLIDGNYSSEPNEAFTESLTTKKDEATSLYAPLSSDSTQMEAVLAAGEDNSFVLHGPPGSGKSQTITNMISHTVASGKTVLFVAEKMAALDVVQNRLDSIGLADFCLEIYSNKGQKKDILKQLNTSFDIQRKVKDTNWSEKSEEIKELKSELNKVVHDLHQSTTVGMSIFDMIEAYSDLTEPDTMIEFDRNQVNEMDEIKLKRAKQLIENIAVASEPCGKITENPWIGMRQTNYSLSLHDTLKEKLSAIESNAAELHQAEDVFTTLEVPKESRSHQWYAFLYKMNPYLQNMPNTNVSLIEEEQFDKLHPEITEVINVGKQRDEETAKMEERFDKNILKIDAEALMQNYRLAENSWFIKEMLDKGKVKKELKKHLKTKNKIETDELESIITGIQKIQEKQQFLEQHEAKMKQYFPERWNNGFGKWDEMGNAIQWMKDVRLIIKELGLPHPAAAKISQNLQEKKQSLTASEMKNKMKAYSAVYEEIMSLWKKVEEALVVEGIHDPEQSDWAGHIKDKSSRLIAALPQLNDNCKLAKTIEDAEEFGLGHVTKPFITGALEHDNLLSAYLYGFYRIRIDEEIAKSEDLSQFSEAGYENKLDHFHNLDDELSELTKLEVYVKLMDRIPDLNNNSIQSSEPGILAKAIKSKGRGIAIRSLFERTKNLLPKIKPIMLMSPLSVAQYLDVSFPKFDLVIFDEASQLPTSEAIGAMGRGKNVVVVGDPKQLPPTDFFGTKQADDNFDLQDLESVLDDSLAVRMPQKHLRWHYRSEHESLISFSNNHFYESNLVTFPSKDDIHSRVSFKNVGGVYDRGKSKQNKIEAEAIINEIFARLSNPDKQHESIGVVTFSQPQQTLIEDMIDERLKEDAQLEKYFTDEVEEPVFVKNLENVQGDERDIILFTVGYGPDQEGHVTLNFGPLNRDGGWRRLNVAVSRAKKEMMIFASMEPDKINLSRTKAEGVHSLKAFMEFAKKGYMPQMIENRVNSSKVNSTVIIPKIKQVLHEHGYQVKTNVGNSEFKVDLAVVDKTNNGQYIAAIQLDGNRYASRSTTRDRNKLGDTMLGRLGWHIIKIWSIEWWHNEEKQLQKLLAQLKEIENQSETIKKAEKPKATEQKSIHDRVEELTIEEVEKKNDSYYEAAVLEDVEASNDYFYTYEGRPIIQEQIFQIINKEAPVSFTRLTKAIIGAWGFSRSGAKLEKVIHNTLQSMKIYESTEEKDTFLWEDKDQFSNYNAFRIKNHYRRALQDISKFEYANGVLEMMQTALRLPKADLIRELSKQLGYNRTSSNAEKYVQEAIDINIEKGLITEDAEGNIVLKG